MRPPAGTTRFRDVWESVRESYWFVPSLLLGLAVALATVTLAVDHAVDGATAAGWFYGGGAEGARSILNTVASSMITVAGVAFSITIVAMTLASNQFGARLLRNYVRDRGNQVTLGTFVATFLYCLLVVRTVRMPAEGGGFVPHLSVTVALLLTVVSLAVLVYFIHHTATAIQAPNVVANVGRELDAAIDALYPSAAGAADDGGRPAAAHEEWWWPDRDAAVVHARDGGYVRLVDAEALIALARARGVVIRLLRRPGDFLVAGDALATVRPAERGGGDLADAVCDVVIVGVQRTWTQDAGYAVEQLLQIAVRALSPGVNDPFTAIACVDRLGASLCRLAERPRPSPLRRDADGAVRVITEPASFMELADVAFAMLRWHVRATPTVVVRLLETIGHIGNHIRDSRDAEALRRHAVMIQHGASARLDDGPDRAAIRAACERALSALDAGPARPRA